MTLLDIHPGKKKKKNDYQNDACSPMFKVALFIIAKIWKQSKSPSTDEWKKEVVYTYTIEYHSAVKEKKKKNETLPFATMWMDLASIMLSEKCHTEKDNSKLSFICGRHKTKQANVPNRREINSQI